MKLPSNLPAELLKQLSKGVARNSGSTQYKILTALEDLYGEDGTVDNVLIKLWQTDGVVRKRANVTSAMHTLLKAGKIVRTGRGNYAVAGADTLPQVTTGTVGEVDDE